MVKVFHKYKEIVEALGLRHLDVYRTLEGGRPVDTLRLYDPATGKVIMASLGGIRESLSPEDYLNKLLEALSKEGIKISDKKLQTVRASISKRTTG